MLGYDPWLHTPQEVERLQRRRRARRGELRPGRTAIRSTGSGRAGRPPPLAPVVPHPDRFAGESAADKRARLARGLAEDGRRRRGADDARIRSPGCSTSAAATCRTRRCRCPSRSCATTAASGCSSTAASSCPASTAISATRSRIEPPDEFGPALDALAVSSARVQVDPATRRVWVFDRLQAAGGNIHRAADPCLLPKACKNPVELDGTRAAHRRDGAAVTRFLAWLAREAPKGELARDRRQRPARSLPPRRRAFPRSELSTTISGAGPNGAIVHYRATPETEKHARAGHALSARFRRAISRRHDRHHPHDRDRHAERRDARPLHARAEGPYRARHGALPEGHDRLAARRVGARARCGRTGSTTTTAPATASAAISSVHEGPQRISKAPNTAPLLPGMIVVERARLLQDRRLRHPHREPGRRCSRRSDRSGGDRAICSASRR